MSRECGDFEDCPTGEKLIAMVADNPFTQIVGHALDIVQAQTAEPEDIIKNVTYEQSSPLQREIIEFQEAVAADKASLPDQPETELRKRICDGPDTVKRFGFISCQVCTYSQRAFQERHRRLMAEPPESFAGYE